VAELDFLAADDGQGKFRLGLGEPRSWPLDSEQREMHRHSGYLHWWELSAESKLRRVHQCGMSMLEETTA
jgi:hypothetical protein